MKRFLGFIFLIFITIIGWRIGSSLSSDAISMAIGVMFGVLAGIPTALLVLATGRNEERNTRSHQYQQSIPALPNQGMSYAPQPPVIVVTGQAGQVPQQVESYQQSVNQIGAQQQPILEEPDQRRQSGSRQFKIVGENEEWVDGW